MNNLLDKAKAEVDIILKQGVDSNIKEELKLFLDLCEVLDKSEIMDSQKEYVIRDFNKFLSTGLLTPLTLADDEFETNSYPVKLNIRYAPICKKGNAIINFNAFKVLVRAEYSHLEAKQIAISNYDTFVDKIYISKGGVITGEYIDECIIRQEIVDRHSFNIQSIIKIPVAMIINENEIIYVVDHREPKLKVLSEFYKTPIKINEHIKGKYNLRNYKKLNK